MKSLDLNLPCEEGKAQNADVMRLIEVGQQLCEIVRNASAQRTLAGDPAPAWDEVADAWRDLFQDDGTHAPSGNVVIAGDTVFAGIAEGEQSACAKAVVIEFKDEDALRKALKEGRAAFTVFETP